MSKLNIQDRIKNIIDALGFTNRSFSLKLGVDPTVIHNIVAGRKSYPSFAILEKIILSFDNIDAKWLLTGKGSMYGASRSLVLQEPMPEYSLARSKKEVALENEILHLKGQIEAYKNVIASLSGSK
ncbi:MAG: helix-turn-helix domain-containing protein [Cytophaga sp.]|uniref:helix-turn-helix domain-containing protein n=1 Tax=Cytophaga sp. TaxID=29535 RepID=UPI003F805877